MKVFKKILIANLFFFVLFLNSGLAKVEAVISKIPLDSNPNLFKTLPKTDESEIIISRPQYIVSYNKVYRGPNWVSWTVDESELGNVKRSNSFSTDSDLQEYFEQANEDLKAVKPTEYSKSCFDRGHQAPSGDRTATIEDNKATFKMTNMSPQTPYLNRVIWMHLENYNRVYIATNHKKAHIIAGPIYDQDFGMIGPNSDIKVPSKFFKVIFYLDKNQTVKDINANTPYIAVIMPNLLKDGSPPTYDKSGGCLNFQNDQITSQEALVDESKDWSKYQTNLKTIQEVSQIKLL